jgi:DNA-binding PadR family transcriptional regulator
MDLRSTILGLLNWKPSSGYDLKRLISDSEVFYWSGNNNQIYKSLIELEKDGMVTYQLQEGLPARKIYAITEKGKSALYQSLLETPQIPEIRKGFLIQLGWSDMLSDEQILDLLEKYEDEIASRLRMQQALAARPASSPARSKREKYLWSCIGENLINTLQTELDWVRQTKMGLREVG